MLLTLMCARPMFDAKVPLNLEFSMVNGMDQYEIFTRQHKISIIGTHQ